MEKQPEWARLSIEGIDFYVQKGKVGLEAIAVGYDGRHLIQPLPSDIRVLNKWCENTGLDINRLTYEIVRKYSGEKPNYFSH